MPHAIFLFHRKNNSKERSKFSHYDTTFKTLEKSKRDNAAARRDAPCISFVIIPLNVLFPLRVEGGGATKAAADEAAAFWAC